MSAPVLASSCGGSDGPAEPEAPRATTISIRQGSTSLTFIGQTATLTVLILDQNGSTFQGTPTWSSGDQSVFTVNANGVVTAVGNGSAMVTASLGSLSTTASVSVQQVASAVAVVSGGSQSALSGESLTTPVVVRVQDQGGTGVEGQTVTFEAGAGGTVDPASAVTDADGEASTMWTLGTPLGLQSLTASIAGGASAVISATSLSPVPVPDVTTGGVLILDRPDPSTLETVQAQVTVRNDGDASTGSGFRVQLLSDGQEIASQTLAALGPSESKTLVFTVGPLTAGTHTLRLNADADDAIEEGIETNNSVERSVKVVKQTLVSLGSQSGLTGRDSTEVPKDSTEMIFRIDLAEGVASNLTIELSGGSGDVDLYVEGGERPSTRSQYDDCQSGSPTTVERCQLSPLNETSYHILLHAFTTYSGVTMTLSLGGEVLPYDIELVFVDNGTQTQDDAVRAAAERWESIITTDLPGSDFSTNPVVAGGCGTGSPLVNDVVDDIRIFVRIVAIDGQGGTLAQAGPCVTRGLGHLPIVGTMTFDSDDLEALESNGGLTSVILHEMAHVLGFGTIWTNLSLLKNPSLPSNQGVDTHFSGQRAIEAFNAAGGTNYTGGAKVPVENLLGQGSGDAHWRESVLGLELLTPLFTSGSTNPLSAISVQSMADLGYVVDLSQADAFTGSFSAPPRAGSVPPVTFDLGGDVRSGPIVVVDEKGRIIEVRR